MKSDQSLEERLAESNITDAYQAIAGSDGGFEQLVELLQLDKSNDFVFSNLSCVDFSNSDLRGFDFTGANLRGSFGVNIQLDETTIFDEASVEGSCFATYLRETALFGSRPEAKTMYEMLRGADPYEVSSWLHSRFAEGADRHPLLKRADDETVSTLCAKLLTDEIDLTKRSNLFYHLRSITRSPEGLRELLLHVFALHVHDVRVMQKFITIAGEMYSMDPYISNAILNLSNSGSERVREAAFVTLARTSFFSKHFEQLRVSFFSARNRGIRQRMLLAAAVALGRSSLSAINLKATRADVPFDEVLDVDALLDEGVAAEIAKAELYREIENVQSVNDRKHSALILVGNASSADIAHIIKKQEEVMLTAEVVKYYFVADHPERALGAHSRLKFLIAERKRRTEAQVARAFKRR